MSDVETIEAEVVEQMERLPAIRQHEAIVARAELSVEEVVEQKDKIVQIMEKVMREGVHYGKIPGVQKPTLLKPGAEAIDVALRLAPDYQSEKFFTDDGHLTVTSKCTLRHITTGYIIATGEGLCSSRESKYAWRQGKRKCPDCGAEAIVRSGRRKTYFCISNEGGCGHQFKFGSPKAKELDEQDVERVANEDLPDTWNTVVKMANKRALVAAVLNGTAASDVFTQDVEDQAAGTPVVDSDYFDPTHDQPTPTGGPGEFPMPGSWKAIEEAIRGYDDTTWEAFSTFGGQARALTFGDDTDLSRSQATEFRKIAARAAKWLRDNLDPGKIPPPLRSDMQQAWLIAMEDERELEGPSWRMSPDETDREPREPSDGE